MIRAVVFDYGNVISEPQDASCYRRMAELTGHDAEFFRSSFWRSRPAFDRGTLDGVTMYRELMEEAGIRSDDPDKMARALLEEDLASWAHPSREVTEWGLSLKARGYKLGVLSNMPREFLERHGASVELFVRADIALFSCHLGLVKPEAAIFRELCSRLALSPGEIVFFDDLAANVEGALAAGIRAFLWTGLEQAKLDWERVTS